MAPASRREDGARIGHAAPGLLPSCVCGDEPGPGDDAAVAKYPRVTL